MSEQHKKNPKEKMGRSRKNCAKHLNSVLDKVHKKFKDCVHHNLWSHIIVGFSLIYCFKVVFPDKNMFFGSWLFIVNCVNWWSSCNGEIFFFLDSFPKQYAGNVKPLDAPRRGSRRRWTLKAENKGGPHFGSNSFQTPAHFAWPSSDRRASPNRLNIV